MSKLTFRADDDLIDRVEALDASKSEVMREALRAYLDSRGAPESGASAGTIDAVIEERVDALVEERLAARERDVNVNITLDGAETKGVEAGAPGASDRRTDPARAEDASDPAEERCGQCGEPIAAEHVYCPNCGEKRSRRVFCECGDELRTDWSFCPSCGRRTPAADVLEQS